MLRGLDRGVLATLDRPGSPGGRPGGPYASLVLFAVAHDASPLLLISDLAEHTRNLRVDARMSLLLDGTAGLEDPLAGARATIQGQASPCDDPALRARFLARHPGASAYAGFADFHLFRVAVDAAHLVAGFGQICWLSGAAALFSTEAAALAASEADIVAHMNADHGDALRLYATVLLGLPDGPWRMTGIDPEGVDLRLGGRVARVGFEAPVRDAADARRALAGLAQHARGGGKG